MESGIYAATVAFVGQFSTIFQKTNNENLQPNGKKVVFWRFWKPCSMDED